jgi:hypothetical protein
VRDKSEIGRRLLALYAAVASSYGFPKADAIRWLRQGNLEGSLTNIERHFLCNESAEAESNSMQWKVESLWTLAWAAGLHSTLDFEESCDDDFVHLLPDLNKEGSSHNFINDLKSRGVEEFIKKCDLAYCLHWGAREATLTGKTILGAVPANVILERRRALEWLISDQAWDEVSLDT